MKSVRIIRGCSSIILVTVLFIVYLKNDAYKTKDPSSISIQRFKRSVINTTIPGTNTTKINTFFSPKVWMASFVSVFIISAVGLLGVAVVPLVQKVFYNKIIQYLVALAVGSLTGDAFLHLIPHAILGAHKEEAPGAGGEEGDEEFISVMKGLVALGGVYFFFFAEKFLSMMSDYRAEKRAEEEERQRQLKDPRRSELRRLSAMQIVGAGTLNSGGGAANARRGSHLSNQRDSAMFRRLSKIVTPDDDEDGIMTTGLSSRAMKSVNNLIRFAELDVDDDTSNMGASLSTSPGGFLSVPGTTVTYQPPTEDSSQSVQEKDGEIQLVVPSITIRQDNNDSTNKHHHVTIKDDSNNNKDDGTDVEKKHLVDQSGDVNDHGTMTVVVADKSKSGGHGHGHSHEVPASIAAVAWMVILGDGLHNFSDGLAIGAAFADKISGGISTAVAVFCHELPHELGDFAVLLKTGMSVKQALFYNIVSSVLCFLGMIIGIALNNVEDASYWIFAVTAGTFVYIALVDMLPELNSAEVRPGESRIVHFLIQNMGLATGVGIMLLIALFEENIKSLLD